MRALSASLLLLVTSLAHAAPPPATQREIAQLFDALEHSGCRFERNGSWYDAPKAREHLQRKYDYLLRRDAVRSTEAFIDLAASKSSMSGRPYRVQCAGTAPIDSGPWFRNVLARVRARH